MSRSYHRRLAISAEINNTDALYRDQAIILQDLWEAFEKFESELPEDKLPRQQRLFDIDKVRRVS